MKRVVCLLLFVVVSLFPFSVEAHIIPTVTHTYEVHLGEKSSDVDITYFYDPVVISRYIRDFDLNNDKNIDNSEKKAWQEKFVKNIHFTSAGKVLPLEKLVVTVPDINGLMNDGQPVEITGLITLPLSCSETTKLEITDNNAFMSVDDDIYTFDVFKKGCLNSSLINPARNKAIALVGKMASEEEKKTGIVKGAAIKQPPTTASQISELTQILKNKDIGSSVLLWALAISFVLGGLHALTPGHGKTLVAAYLVGQHGTKKDALILALVTTLTHTSSIYILGLLSLFATQYFLPERIIPALETISALAIFGMGVWLLSKRWAELQHEHAHHHEHEHSHEHHDHAHGTGPGQHVHTLQDLKGQRLGLRSLISLGFSGGIVPCADALAIMIIAIGLNKTVLGMILIIFFSLGLAAVLVGLGVLMVTSRNLFERFAPSNSISRYFPVASAVIIICIGGLLVLKAVKII